MLLKIRLNFMLTSFVFRFGEWGRVEAYWLLGGGVYHHHHHHPRVTTSVCEITRGVCEIVSHTTMRVCEITRGVCEITPPPPQLRLRQDSA